jgi:myo-inositol 2-dehydrogenase / D-chiro-inositol 1-dehydrogenase
MRSEHGPVRFGLIGYGAWGVQHARAIHKTEGAQLAAIVTRSEENRAAARDLYPDAKLYSDFREMLSRESPEVVDIVLPAHLHFETARAALESGAHVLLEKPMCLRLEDCDQLTQTARERRRVLAIGHEFRFSSLWGKAREMVAAGAIGEPRYCLIELWRRPYRLGSGGWRYNLQEVGNWILEEPIHFFDLARGYFQKVGEPVSVFAAASHKRDEHPELQDNFSAILHFPNGGYAVISQTLAAYEHHQVVKVTGTRGALWASWSGALDRTFHPTFSLKYFDGEKTETIPIEKITGEVFELEDEIADMTAAVRGAPLHCATPEDGQWSVAMCLKAQESVATGKLVKF